MEKIATIFWSIIIILIVWLPFESIKQHQNSPEYKQQLKKDSFERCLLYYENDLDKCDNQIKDLIIDEEDKKIENLEKLKEKVVDITVEENKKDIATERKSKNVQRTKELLEILDEMIEEENNKKN